MAPGQPPAAQDPSLQSPGLQDPGLQTGPAQNAPDRARPADWRDPVLLAIFVCCLVPEAVLSGADWQLWGDPRWRTAAVQNAGFWAGLLQNWRPNYALQPMAMWVTYGFLHAGALHFLVNMMTLFSLGAPLVEHLGRPRFLLVYAASIVGGAAGFALLSSQVLPMVGASGALFGLAGAHVGLHYRDRRASHDPLMPVVRTLAGLVVLNLVLWWAMAGQLAWETHLGGFVTGWIVALWLDRRPGAPPRPDQDDSFPRAGF